MDSIRPNDEVSLDLSPICQGQRSGTRVAVNDFAAQVNGNRNARALERGSLSFQCFMQINSMAEL